MIDYIDTDDSGQFSRTEITDAISAHYDSEPINGHIPTESEVKSAIAEYRGRRDSGSAGINMGRLTVFGIVGAVLVWVLS